MHPDNFDAVPDILYIVMIGLFDCWVHFQTIQMFSFTDRISLIYKKYFTVAISSADQLWLFCVSICAIRLIGFDWN